MKLPSQSPTAPYKNLMEEKQQLIDFTFSHVRPKPHSMADLGGVWNVDGAYTFYTLDTYPVEEATLIDTRVLDTVVDRAEQYPQLSTWVGNFGEDAVIRRLGTVDVVFLFDVLLHQVSPNWDEVLELYASRTQYMAIFNQQYTRSSTTVRLLDLGRDEYFQNVPRGPADGPYCDLFEKLDEIHPEHDRPWRDIHNIWQWGITDRDLVAKMELLSFKLQFFANFGQFRKLRYFENHSFLFQKVDSRNRSSS